MDEAKEGLIDIEALVLLTLMLSADARLLGDVALWLTCNSDILIHQKLRVLAGLLDEPQQLALARALGAGSLSALPSLTLRALGGVGSGDSETRLTPSKRIDKLAPRKVIAERSCLVRNRLLFGSSVRADLVSVLQCQKRPTTGRGLAQLIGASPATVSRLLDDLSMAGFLTSDGSPAPRWGRYPGFFLSADTVRHLPGIIFAADLHDIALRRAALPALDRSTDRLGWLVAEAVGSGVG